jgi:hypothetical protein
VNTEDFVGRSGEPTPDSRHHGAEPPLSVTSGACSVCSCHQFDLRQVMAFAGEHPKRPPTSRLPLRTACAIRRRHHGPAKRFTGRAPGRAPPGMTTLRTEPAVSSQRPQPSFRDRLRNRRSSNSWRATERARPGARPRAELGAGRNTITGRTRCRSAGDDVLAGWRR